MSEEKHLDDHRNDITGNGETAVSKRIPDPEKLARLVIRDGKTFYHSALEAGYAETVAHRGFKSWVLDSKRCAEAVRKETERMVLSLDKLKPHAVSRLAMEILDVTNGSNGLRAIEIAGRFKETDWFIRSSEFNLGMFVSIADESPDNPEDNIKE